MLLSTADPRQSGVPAPNMSRNRSGTPEDGTIVLRCGLPNDAASHCVPPSEDLPDMPTAPVLHGCSPSQVIAWSMSPRSSGPIISMHPPLSPVPRTASSATA
jgi:hypothetical protein